jgi:1L-myo-inositol 1-phosphate cytidylyltransferase / CDP-L-myo-inositol myo-inositolphosphotransferase
VSRVVGIDGFAGAGASLEQLGEWGQLRAGVVPLEFGSPAAVILAAGAGSRLGVGSKPLARVGGITLLERAVSTLRSVGIEEIIVVVGHERERVCELVGARGLGVRLVENADFSLGNGSSVLLGARAAGRRFLLAMVDHVVDPEALRRLCCSEAAFALAVDSQPRFCDLEEATKVRLEGARVVTIGRELAVWEAVDAGLALCAAEVAEVAQRSLAAGERSWNAVKRRWLAEGGAIEAVDLEGLFWIDVDTPADRRRAERALVRQAAAKPEDGPVARLLNRRLSSRISLVLLRAGVSPGAATVGAFLFALAAAVVLALGAVSTAALVSGGILVQLVSILDGVDGEIARASLRSSPFGGFLDTVLDRTVDAAVLVALAAAAGLDATTWPLLVAALFGSLMTPYVKAAYEATHRSPLPRAPLNLGRDVRLLAASLSAVALQPFWGLVALAVLTNAAALQRFLAAARAH